MKSVLLCSLSCFLSLPSATRAQAPTPPDTVRQSALFQRSDLYTLGAFGAAAVTLFQYDRKLAQWFQSDSRDSRRAHQLGDVLGVVGGPGALATGAVLYIVGRVTQKPRVTELAVHATEAVVVGLSISGALKGTLGRARPYATADSNPRDFELFRGFTGSSWQSFPSGHSTTSFAVAAAVTSEAGEWWPDQRWIVATLLYGGASLVGASRMYDDKHWASDVVMGAAVGTFAGWKTVRYNHARRGNRIDRWLLGADARGVVSPAPDGSLRIGVDARW